MTLYSGVSYSASAANGLMTSETSIPYRTSAGIEPIVVMDSSVTATIVIVNCGIAVVEMSYCIMSIDREVPTAGTPINGSDEVICCQHQVVLPIIKDMT